MMAQKSAGDMVKAAKQEIENLLRNRRRPELPKEMLPLLTSAKRMK
jgi:hypothetical protein